MVGKVQANNSVSQVGCAATQTRLARLRDKGGSAPHRRAAHKLYCCKLCSCGRGGERSDKRSKLTCNSYASKLVSSLFRMLGPCTQLIVHQVCAASMSARAKSRLTHRTICSTHYFQRRVLEIKRLLRCLIKTSLTQLQVAIASISCMRAHTSSVYLAEC